MTFLKDLLTTFTFEPKKLKLGMRTFKTGLAVFLVILLFHFLDLQGMQIATLTAVFSLREDFDKSLHFGFSRVISNSIGGILSLFFFLINQYLSSPFWVTLVFVPIFTMLGIMINVALNNKAGIIGGTAALLIITLSVPVDDTIIYVFSRVFETFLGVFIAILVNADINNIRKKIKEFI